MTPGFAAREKWAFALDAAEFLTGSGVYPAGSEVRSLCEALRDETLKEQAHSSEFLATLTDLQGRTERLPNGSSI